MSTREELEYQQAQEDAEHAIHSTTCPPCQEAQTQRVFMSKRYLATDDARKALQEGIQSALALGVPPEARHALELALTNHAAALLSRI